MRSRDQKEIETINVPVVGDTYMPVAEEEYLKAFAFRKKITALGIAAVIAVEGIIAGSMLSFVTQNNLWQRVQREHEIRSTGQISL